jgi:hypothetical protein
MQNELMNSLMTATQEIEAIEQILNDGIDYDKDFLDALNKDLSDLLKLVAATKGILVRRYGVIAI